MKNVIYTLLFVGSVALTSCGGGSKDTPPNDPPSGVELKLPTDNQLCISNTVDFDWTDATDPNNDKVNYKIVIANDRAMADVAKTQIATTSQVKITLDKSKAYYWSITPVDANNNEGPTSKIFAFFTKGDGVTNAAPFSAKLEAPENGKNDIAAGTVNLRWKGSDVDSDDSTLKYDLYFGDVATPSLSKSGLSVQNKDVTVASGKTYYWKVNTIDTSGAKSIGQVWSFTVQ